MSNIAVNNSSNNTDKGLIKNTVFGATVGAVALGTNEFLTQRAMLQKPDEYIKKIEAEVAKERRFNKPFFKGTQEAADLANKELDKYLSQVKNFIKSGKYNFKKIAINAGLGALAIGATFGAFYKIFKIIGEGIKENTKIISESVAEGVAEGITKAKTDKI